ncbi:hypothetical protein HanPI659440_Chr04g0178511 [Helianthus annuus]|nr:hypothetical protein HanPI659440_Chr04g0178511 [Helianthus annuus]
MVENKTSWTKIARKKTIWTNVAILVKPQGLKWQFTLRKITKRSLNSEPSFFTRSGFIASFLHLTGYYITITNRR